MDELIRKLDSDEWLTSANELYFYLKDKFQGQKGSIKRVRNIYDDERREKLFVKFKINDFRPYPFS